MARRDGVEDMAIFYFSGIKMIDPFSIRTVGLYE
jgi:hypothetical protein